MKSTWCTICFTIVHQVDFICKNTVLMTARQLSLFWAILSKSQAYQYVPLRPILIISHHFCLGLPSGYFTTRHKNNVYTCHIVRPAHSSWSDHVNDIWWEVHVIKLVIMPPITLSVLGPNLPLQPTHELLSTYVLLLIRKPHSRAYKITGKIIVLCILISLFLDK